MYVSIDALRRSFHQNDLPDLQLQQRFFLTVGTSLSGSSDSDVRLSARALAVVSEKTSVDTGTLEILNNLYADCSNVVVGMSCEYSPVIPESVLN
jgi:hypothetical protein